MAAKQPAAKQPAAKSEAGKPAVKSEAGKPARVRKAALVLPTYSLKKVKTGDILAIRIDSAIATKPDTDHKTGLQKNDKQGNPAFLHLVNVTDLDTGAVGELLLPFIMHKAFAREEEKASLIGRCFELIKGEEKTGSATAWEVYEIDTE